MREIKFRGKNKETGEWAYGYYTKLVEGIRKFDAIISDIDGELTRFYIHHPETIGQYTGLKDKNGKEIYEGDILKTYVETGIDSYWKTCKVVWNKMGGAFILKARTNDEKSWYSLSKIPAGELEIIGNIYENPELLK